MLDVRLSTKVIPDKDIIERFKQFKKEYGSHKTWCETNRMVIDGSFLISLSCNCGFSDFDDIS